MDTRELTEDEIAKIISSLPPSACRSQICDIIINMLIAYNMHDDFIPMAALINEIIENLSESDIKGSPIH